MALNSDPLADSDEEKPDENLLLDYSTLFQPVVNYTLSDIFRTSS